MKEDFSLLLIFHLSKEKKHCGDKKRYAVSEHPPDMREYIRKITAKNGSLHIDTVDKGQ
jgi:hypothetical protein